MILLYLEWVFLKSLRCIMNSQLENIIFQNKGLDTWQSKEHAALLTELINELINTDFPKLIQLVYRLDIPEKKLKENLASYDKKDAAEIISAMIINRQSEKIISREKFSRKDSENNEERW